MIFTRTPYRVSLFGGGSDYPEHFLTHEGAVLGMAIDKYVYIGVKRMPPGQGPRYRIVYSKIEDVMEIDQIQHPAVRGCLQRLNINEPLEIVCTGDLASGGGLGASSAFVVGLLHALRLHSGTHELTVTPAALANDAIYTERNVIGEAVGYQDQLLTAHGNMNFIRFGANGWTIHPVVMSSERLGKLTDSLVLVYSGTMRHAHVMAAKQVARVAPNAALLDELARSASAGLHLLRNENLNDLGDLLHDSWRIKRDLHPEISSPEIDRLYSHGLSLGALGGKLCGAGGGGFLLFFVPPEKRKHFEQHIGAPCVRFRIAPRGTHVLVNEP